MCRLQSLKPKWFAVFITLLLVVPILLFYSQSNITQKALEKTESHLEIIKLANAISSYAKRAEGHLFMYYTIRDDADKGKFFDRYNSMIELSRNIAPLFSSEEQRMHIPIIQRNATIMYAFGSSILDNITSGNEKNYESDLREFHRATSLIRKEGVLIVEETSKLLKANNDLFLNDHDNINYLVEFSYIFLLSLLIALYILFRKFCEAKQKAEIAREEAEQLNNTKTQFLASMSHDLRTPLNAIIGFSDIMKTQLFGPLGNSNYKDYANDISNCGNLLITLIDDILEISKIETGNYRLSEEYLCIASLTKASINMVSVMADADNIQLTSNFDTQLPKLRGDKKAMMQILNNLITNAVKFTPSEGEVSITARLNTNDSLSILISDTGEGMSKGEITKALLPFEQAHSAHSKNHKGNGLGLYICQNLVRLHDGSLEIVSAIAQGTTVMVHFPPERTVHPSNLLNHSKTAA